MRGRDWGERDAGTGHWALGTHEFVHTSTPRRSLANAIDYTFGCGQGPDKFREPELVIFPKPECFSRRALQDKDTYCSATKYHLGFFSVNQNETRIDASISIGTTGMCARPVIRDALSDPVVSSLTGARHHVPGEASTSPEKPVMSISIAEDNAQMIAQA